MYWMYYLFPCIVNVCYCVLGEWTYFYDPSCDIMLCIGCYYLYYLSPCIVNVCYCVLGEWMYFFDPSHDILDVIISITYPHVLLMFAIVSLVSGHIFMTHPMIYCFVFSMMVVCYWSQLGKRSPPKVQGTCRLVRQLHGQLSSRQPGRKCGTRRRVSRKISTRFVVQSLLLSFSRSFSSCHA